MYYRQSLSFPLIYSSCAGGICQVLIGNSDGGGAGNLFSMGRGITGVSFFGGALLISKVPVSCASLVETQLASFIIEEDFDQINSSKKPKH
jgi:hypothetical protein